MNRGCVACLAWLALLAPACRTAAVDPSVPAAPGVELRAADPVPIDALLRVQVLAAETGEPLTTARVEIHPLGEGGRPWFGAGDLLDSLRPDPRGIAEFELEPGRARTLSVCADFSYASGTSAHGSATRPVAPLAPGEQRTLVVRVPTREDVVLHGVLVDAETGEGLSGGAVQVEGRACFSSGKSASGVEWERVRVPRLGAPVAADERGRFELRAKSWDARGAVARAPGYARVHFPLAPGHSAPERALEVRLARAATLEAHVVDERGEPVAGAIVELACDGLRLVQQLASSPSLLVNEGAKWSARTDASGKAVVSDLPARVPLDLASEIPLRGRRVEGRIELAPGEVRSVRLAWGEGGVVRGTLRDQRGAPLGLREVWRLVDAAPGRRMRLLEGGATPVAVARSDARGRFEFAAVPAGSWMVGLAPPEPATEPGDAAGVAASHPGLAEALRVEAGRVVDLELVVPADLGLRGRVVDPSGAPRERCRVVARHAAHAMFVSATTGPDGSFALAPLPAGAWRLWSQDTPSELAASAALEAEAGSADLVLRLRRGGQLAGRFTDARGGAVPDVTATLAAGAGDFLGERICAAGEFRFGKLAPATYRVWAWDRDGAIGCSAALELVEGATIEGIEVALEPGARLALEHRGRGPSVTALVRARGSVIQAVTLRGFDRCTLTVPAEALWIDWCSEDTGQAVRSDRIELAAGEDGRLAWD